MQFTLIALALAFNFVNGFQGTGSSVATIISSRAMNPRPALIFTAIAVFCGPLLFGVAVARTIGAGILTPQNVTPAIAAAALTSAVAWSLFTWFIGIPSSPSHALVGGLVGTALAAQQVDQIQTAGIVKVILSLLISPPLGLLMGVIFTRLVFFLARNASLKINGWFLHGQLVTGLGLALSNGANDAPKGMGMMALGLVSLGVLDEFQIPPWMVISCALAISLGSLLGGWRIIKTLGGKFFRVRPVDSFCSQLASTSIILSAALLGGPVSTTQVVSSAILGTGAALRPNKVRWGVAKNIALTWLLTIPANIALAWLLYWGFQFLA